MPKRKSKKKTTMVVPPELIVLDKGQRKGQQFCLVQAKGNGNCHWNATAMALGLRQTQYRQVKNPVVNFLRDNGHLFDKFPPESEEHPDPRNWDDYCKKIAKNGVYAGEIELLATSRVLK